MSNPYNDFIKQVMFSSNGYQWPYWPDPSCQQQAIVRDAMNSNHYWRIQDDMQYQMQMQEMAMKAQIQKEQDDRAMWGEELWAIMRETDRLAGLL